MNILSLNGGGSLGYAVAVILNKLEEELNKPCKEIFDLIAGVSTGSIIGYGLASGISAKQIMLCYEDFIPKIFRRKSGLIMSLFKPYYNINDLRKAIYETYNGIEIYNPFTKFMTYATQVTGKYVQPKFWKSWKDNKENALDMIVASCAAPLYFAPYKINNDWFVDGGLSSNSPNMSAIVEAIKMNINFNEIKLLNITPNGLSGFKKPNRELVGLTRVARHAVGISLFGSEMDKNYQSRKLLGSNFYYINCECGLPMDSKLLIDIKNFAEMYWYTHKYDILYFLNN